MKRTIKSFLLVGAVATTLVSCIKERDMNIDGSKSVGMVAFANTGDDVASSSSVFSGFYSDLGSLAAGASTNLKINVQYAGPSEAPADITVKLELDAAALAKYNTDNGTALVVPPASVFALPATAVIKKGTRMAQVTAKITNSADFDFTKSYALPVKISDAAGTAISSNLGKAVYTFGLRNIYDGHYSLKGYTLRAGDPAKTGNFVRPAGMDLVTVGGSAVQFAELQVWTDLTGVGVGYPILNVGANNAVTLSSSGGIYNTPGYNCRYEPATKTFYVSFAWGAGPASRLATDTLTYIGPRH